jgi:hypothetical protein
MFVSLATRHYDAESEAVKYRSLLCAKEMCPRPSGHYKEIKQIVHRAGNYSSYDVNSLRVHPCRQRRAFSTRTPHDRRAVKPVASEILLYRQVGRSNVFLFFFPVTERLQQGISLAYRHFAHTRSYAWLPCDARASTPIACSSPENLVAKQKIIVGDVENL